MERGDAATSGNQSRSNATPLFHPALLATLITAAALAPFLDKAFHIDDPVYVAVAQQITKNPLDFYGFDMNWYGTAMPVHEFNQNPPGVSYVLAVVGLLFGWSEPAMHVSLLLAALAAALGTYFLARRLGAHPYIATLATAFTPGFLVSSTNVMADVLMLACYVWAIALWVWGIQSDTVRPLAAAGILAGLAVLTKYFALSLVPLLLVYGIVRKRGVGVWAAWSLIPIATVLLYEWITWRLYGHTLFTTAASYAAEHTGMNGTRPWFVMGLVGLSFVGGCFVSILCFAPLIWSWRIVALGILLAALVSFIPNNVAGFFDPALAGQVQLSLLNTLLFGVFVVGVVAAFGLSLQELIKQRNAETLLLFLWISGTFVFSAFVNWTVNSRSLLPMGPAIGILIGRELLQYKGQIPMFRVVPPLAISAGIALWAAWADAHFADTSRRAAPELARQAENVPGTLYFTGHWGFQYYMEAAGVAPWDFEDTVLAIGDAVAIPRNNTNVRYINPQQSRLAAAIAVPNPTKLATVNLRMGAGFYSHGYGPLPFAVGDVPAEVFQVFEITVRDRNAPGNQ